MIKKNKILVISAVFTAFVSTLCCLPAFLFLFFGVSSGVFSYFTSLEYIRVPFAILTIIFFVFTVINFRKKISCKCTKKEKTKQYLFFSITFILLLVLLFYPEFIPYFME